MIKHDELARTLSKFKCRCVRKYISVLNLADFKCVNIINPNFYNGYVVIHVDDSLKIISLLETGTPFDEILPIIKASKRSLGEITIISHERQRKLLNGYNAFLGTNQKFQAGCLSRVLFCLLARAKSTANTDDGFVKMSVFVDWLLENDFEDEAQELIKALNKWSERGPNGGIYAAVRTIKPPMLGHNYIYKSTILWEKHKFSLQVAEKLELIKVYPEVPSSKSGHFDCEILAYDDETYLKIQDGDGVTKPRRIPCTHR